MSIKESTTKSLDFQVKDKPLDGNKMSAELVDMERAESDPNVRRRVKALKKLQFKRLMTDGNVAQKEMTLKMEYLSDYQTLDQKRIEIINGKCEPNDEDCQLVFESDSEDETPNQKSGTKSESVKGIPGFWLKAMLNLDAIAYWVEDVDQPVLCHLNDIQATVSQNPWKIKLSFRFNPNDYFANEVLTKEYEIGFGGNTENPWDVTGFYPKNRKGCSIDWKNGKNITRKAVTSGKKSKNGEKTVSIRSFFDFFTFVTKKSSDENESDLEEDWTLGKAVFLQLIPFAVLYYTGDLFDGDESESTQSSTQESESDSSS